MCYDLTSRFNLNHCTQFGHSFPFRTHARTDARTQARTHAHRGIPLIILECSAAHPSSFEFPGSVFPLLGEHHTTPPPPPPPPVTASGLRLVTEHLGVGSPVLGSVFLEAVPRTLTFLLPLSLSFISPQSTEHNQYEAIMWSGMVLNDAIVIFITLLLLLI